jgi:hypothetical protein
MVEVCLTVGIVTVSMLLSMAVIFAQRQSPQDSRGIVGLLATVVHMLTTLALAAGVWLLIRPPHILTFVISLLICYWVSLIFLVIAIIRYIRSDSGNSPSAKAGKVKL